MITSNIAVHQSAALVAFPESTPGEIVRSVGMWGYAITTYG